MRYSPLDRLGRRYGHSAITKAAAPSPLRALVDAPTVGTAQFSAEAWHDRKALD